MSAPRKDTAMPCMRERLTRRLSREMLEAVGHIAAARNTLAKLDAISKLKKGPHESAMDQTSRAKLDKKVAALYKRTKTLTSACMDVMILPSDAPLATYSCMTDFGDKADRHANSMTGDDEDDKADDATQDAKEADEIDCSDAKAESQSRDDAKQDNLADDLASEHPIDSPRPETETEASGRDVDVSESGVSDLYAMHLDALEQLVRGKSIVLCGVRATGVVEVLRAYRRWLDSREIAHEAIYRLPDVVVPQNADTHRVVLMPRVRSNQLVSWLSIYSPGTYRLCARVTRIRKELESDLQALPVRIVRFSEKLDAEHMRDLVRFLDRNLSSL